MVWKNQGKSPDYRFTLANERTFLAWIRTALAFMAAAIGIDQLAPDIAPDIFRGGIIAVLGITAAGLSFYAYRRWSENEKAMRQEADLPFPGLLIWLSSGLSAGVMITLIVLVML